MGYKGYLPLTRYATADAYMGQGPGVVYWIQVTVSSGDGTLRIYDGRDTSGDVLATFKGTAGRDRVYHFNPVLPFERGLYIDAVDHIQNYTIAYDYLDL